MQAVTKVLIAVIALLAALLLGAMLLVVLALGADRAGACTGPDSARQPNASREAESTIPAHYLRLYQLTGAKYRIPWVYLAAMGKLESDHGRGVDPGINSGANSAGAAGPMQIGIGGAATDMWSRFKTDGNGDGRYDIYDPADAIAAAARILIEDKGYFKVDPRTAIRRYNGAGPEAERYATRAMQWAEKYAAGNFSVGQDAGTGQSDAAACTPADVSGLVQKIIAFAMAQRGKPYVFGATGPDAWDCSSLIQAAYAAVGITIPRTTFQQWPFGVKITKGTEQPGDLVFFNSGPGTSANNPGHVGMVINPTEGTMIVARCASCRPAIGVQNYKTRRDWMGSTRPLARPDIRAKLGLGSPSDALGRRPGGGKSPLMGNNITATMGAVVQELDQRYGPFPTIGCYRSGAGAQDHALGRACDFMVTTIGRMPSESRRQLGDAVASYTVANARRLNISYVIWKQQIWNIQRPGWRAMNDRGNITQNHFDHVHISVLPGNKDRDR
ncbi:C40 family peptidase [Actinomadura kijaniata]|uniref:C40 family peptidase n=1 Tax=Actinomadura kijaniata TaxID=46161 RepID=UPI000833B0FB|nr:NlpC/P60 family protein [Actinomadura kijaniata]